MFVSLFTQHSKGYSSSTGYSVPPFILAQPQPCACLNVTNLRLTRNCTAGRTEADLTEIANCGYPFPSNLGIVGQCREFPGIGWAWTPAIRGDVFFPDNVLADFCTSNFVSDGNLLVPLSSNISIWRQADGTNFLNNRTVGTISMSGVVYNYGWLLVTLNNLTNPTVPPNATVLRDVYIARSFNLANKTQVKYDQLQENM